MAAELMMACTSDFSGLVRGKGFRATDLDRKVARGIGWTPTNVQITCFDTIADSPYGALGDLVLRGPIRPPGERRPPARRHGCCTSCWATSPTRPAPPGNAARAACCAPPLARFWPSRACDLRATFEHEFMFPGARPHPRLQPCGLRPAAALCAEALVDALDGRGSSPTASCANTAPTRWRSPSPPPPPCSAADEAVIAARGDAGRGPRRWDRPPTFSPLVRARHRRQRRARPPEPLGRRPETR